MTTSPDGKTEPKAVTSFVFGLLSIVLSILAGIPAIVFGHVARHAIKRSPGRVKGAGMALAGLVMGYLSVVIFVIIGIAALTFPLLIRAVRDPARQSIAVAHLRTISTAEITYLAAGGSYGSIPQLISAGLLDDSFAKPTGGYAFEVQASPGSYTATATPTAANSGRYGYLSFEDGVVRYQTQTSATCNPCFPAGRPGSPVE